MQRRLLIAPLVAGLAVLASTSTALATVTPATPQGPVNGKSCGISTDFAVQGGTPQEVDTTSEVQTVTTTSKGKLVVMECIGLLPSSAKTKHILAIETTTCAQFNPFVPAAQDAGIAGSNTIVVIGKLFGGGGVASGTCRTVVTTPSA